MPVKRLKDRRGLIARRSLLASHVYERRASGAGGKPSRQYFALYLWENPEQLRRAADLEGRALGCHCPTPVRIQIEASGEETPVPRRLLGELHYVAGEWTDEVVAHELTHALFECHRSDVGATVLTGEGDQPFSHEEEWCYRFGRWFAVVYKFLWKNDPTLAKLREEVS